jgi:hypothetical protein
VINPLTVALQPNVPYFIVLLQLYIVLKPYDLSTHNLIVEGCSYEPGQSLDESCDENIFLTIKYCLNEFYTVTGITLS